MYKKNVDNPKVRQALARLAWQLEQANRTYLRICRVPYIDSNSTRLETPVNTDLDVRLLPISGRKPASVTPIAVQLGQMQIVEQERAPARTRSYLPRTVKKVLEATATSSRFLRPQKAKELPATSTTIEPTPIIFYSDIVALVEVTFGSKSFNDEMVQAAGYVREIRFSQPFLHFVPCLFLNHHPTCTSPREWHFRIVHFDPAGYWHSGPHQLCSSNNVDFSSVLRYLTSCNVGYPLDTVLNPPCHSSSEKRHPVTILVGNSRTVKLVKFLWIRKNLMGRCTFAYLAEGESGPPFVIKESWPDSGRKNEVEFLKIAAKRKVPNMAFLHPEFSDTDPSAFIVTTSNDVRQNSSTSIPGSRRALRIPLDRQGFPIEEASCPLLILAVMYCAISGRRKLPYCKLIAKQYQQSAVYRSP